MKKIKQPKKLRLNSETVKALTSHDLKRIIGRGADTGVDIWPSVTGDNYCDPD
jgi:hypothetical protein